MASLADAVAADVWKRVMVFTTPLEWLRSSVAGHRLFGVFRLYLPGLVESATLPPIASCIFNGDAVDLWLHLKRDPARARAPLGGVGDTNPLMALAEHSPSACLSVGKLLLQARADINTRDADGETPLHPAVAFSPAEFVRFLIQERACVNARSQFGATPLHYAATRDEEMVSLLLSARAVGLDAQCCYEDEDSSHDGATPILIASERNKLPVVQKLISCGARGVNIAKANGVTPLVVAAYKGYLQLLTLLLSVNTEDPGVPVRDRPWASPMIAACDSGHVGAVNLLLEARASIDAPCRSDGEVPLIAAVREGHSAVVRRLLDANANARDVCLSHPIFTPLYLAASSGRPDIVKLLLAAEASPAVRAVARTPLETATRHGHAEVVQVLLSAGMSESE